MKKKFVIPILFSFIIAFLFTSCSLGVPKMGMFDNDRSKSDKRFEQILDAIKTKNESALERLFSKKAISEAKDMNGSINELFIFFQGDVVSYNDWGGVASFGGKNDDGTGRNWYSIQSTFDVKTSKEKYRFAIEEFTLDTADPNNVGILSLYIIKMKDDTDSQFAYHGDNKWTPGINFNIKNVLPDEDSSNNK